MQPNLAILTEKYRDEFKVLIIDTKKATYQGIPWVSLGDFGKRKFENFLVLSRNTREKLKIIYQ